MFICMFECNSIKRNSGQFATKHFTYKKRCGIILYNCFFLSCSSMSYRPCLAHFSFSNDQPQTAERPEIPACPTVVTVYMSEYVLELDGHCLDDERTCLRFSSNAYVVSWISCVCYGGNFISGGFWLNNQRHIYQRINVGWR